MKAGRVSRSVRKWANFSFLLLLLVVVGWYSWKVCIQKVMEIPSGYAQVITKKSGIPFFRKTEELVRKPGKYAINSAEVESIQNGQTVCIPLGQMTYDVQGVLETSSTLQGLSAKVGWGHKSYATYSGAISIQVDEESVKRFATGDSLNRVKESFGDAISRSSQLLREENVDKFKEQVSGKMQEALGVPHISISFDSLEYKDEGVPAMAMTLRKGQVVTPAILEEMPSGGYLSIGIALFATTFIYALVRVVFAEVLGVLFVLFIGVPLSAFGFGNFQLHEPGYYQSRRRRGSQSGARSGSETGYGVGDALIEVGGMAADILPSHHAQDLGDAVGSLGEAAGSVGDVADALGGIGEAAGSIFDGLGAIGDLF
jgi:hypothetical protein